MSWFKRDKTGIEKSSTKHVKVPEGLWTKCPGCSESLLTREIEDNLQVCPKCGHHYRKEERIGVFVETYHQGEAVCLA